MPINATILATTTPPPPPPPPPPPDNAAPAYTGPWLAINSPWRTPITSDWANFVHPDTASMVQNVWVDTANSNAVHAFAYRPTEMAVRYPSGPYLTYMKWCGPGGNENVIFSPTGTATITVWEDFPTYKAASYQVPMPLNWTGYDKPNLVAPAYYERRCTVVSQNGDLWYLAHVTPPGDPIAGFSANTDTAWHAQRVVKDAHGGWTGKHPAWNGGGSGLPFFAGLITPYDILNTPVGGDYGHVIASNGTWNASGAFAGHPAKVWPTPWIVYGTKPNTDGKVPTIVGSPYGARIFLDPSLTDSDLNALGVVKEWQLQIARTMQRYGLYSKEQAVTQGGAGQLLCETVESIAWNAAHGPSYYAGFQWPWIADGTTNNVDMDITTYGDAFTAALMPTTNSHWKVADWTKDWPGITADA